MLHQLTNKRIVIASHNPGKIQEISALLASFPFQVTDAATLKLDVPEETGNSYLDNALIKARACAKATQLPAWGDDSGLEVSALSGKPGVHTALYTKEQGGREKVFSLWSNLPEIKTNAGAAFVCVQVVTWPDGHHEYVEYTMEGSLTFPPRGNNGHGYDPVFIPKGQDRTMAEMELWEKNIYSFRAITFRKLLSKLKNLGLLEPQDS